MKRVFLTATVVATFAAWLAACPPQHATCETNADCPTTAFCDQQIHACILLEEDAGHSAADGGGDAGESVDGGMTDSGTPEDAGVDAGEQDAGVIDAGVQEPICSVSGICWANPRPQGNHLTAVHRASNGLVHVGAWGGAILTWDGTWKVTRNPTVGGWVSSMDGVAADDIWAVGVQTLLRWNGEKWLNVAQPGASHDFRSVFARASDDVWIVTFDGEVHRWNGASFDSSSVGAPGGYFGIWAASETDAWVVGMGGAVHHWNGSQWTPVATNTTADLTGVWGASSNDVWFTGSAGTMLHWDGSALSPVNVNASGNIVSVRGTSANDVWAPSGSGLLHWTGADWEVLSIPSGNVAAAVSPASASEVWVSGVFGFVGRLADGKWTTWAEGRKDTLNAVWTFANGDAWAVGDEGLVLRRGTEKWSVVPSGTLTRFTGVWGHDNDVWIVGEAGKILRWNGTGFAPFDSGTTNKFISIWGSASDDVWVTTSTAARHWDGATWTSVPIAQTGPMSGTSSADIWMAAGALLHWNGSAWVDSGLGDRGLRTVHAVSSSEAYAAGENGEFRIFDGSDWVKKETGTTDTLDMVYAASPGEVWIGASYATLLMFNGINVSPQSSGTASFLHALSGFGPNTMVAVGEGAAVLEVKP